MTQPDKTKKSDKGAAKAKPSVAKKPAAPVAGKSTKAAGEAEKAKAEPKPKKAAPTKTSKSDAEKAVEKPARSQKVEPKKAAKTPAKAPSKEVAAKPTATPKKAEGSKPKSEAAAATKSPSKSKSKSEKTASEVPALPATTPPAAPAENIKKSAPKKAAAPTPATPVPEVVATSVERAAPEVEPAASPVANEPEDFPAEISATLKVLLGLEIEPQLATQIEKIGLAALTPAQLTCLPQALEGTDLFLAGVEPSERHLIILAAAGNRMLRNKIGRGKPRSPAVLIIQPHQAAINEALAKAKGLLNPLGLKTWALYEGQAVDEKSERSLEAGPDILIATPQGLQELQNKKAIRTGGIGLIVCDGLDDIAASDHREIVAQFLQDPHLHQPQRLFLAPAVSDKARAFAAQCLEQAQRIDTGIINWCSAHSQNQKLYAVPSVEKFPILLGWLGERKAPCAVVFANTRWVAEWLTYKLIKNGFKADLLTSMPLPSRQQQLNSRIQKGELNVLVATDAAARTLLIPGLADVYNFDVPEVPENYLERMSCLSRETPHPQMVTLLCEDYGYHMKGVVECIGFMPTTEAPPERFGGIEDISDMPFDAKGKVKPIWDPRPVVAEAPREGATTERPAARPSSEGVSAERTSRPPEGERTASRPRPTPTAAVPSAERPSHARPSRPVQDGERPPQVERPAAAAAAPRDEAKRRGKPTGEGKQSRRDEKARETIEAALAAARDAAKRKQESVGLPTGDVKKDFSNLVLIAREGIAAALDVVQERALAEIEKRFPAVSGYVKKVWRVKKPDQDS